MDLRLFEPSKYYKQELKQKFADEIEKAFNDFVSLSGIDEEENRKTSSEYRKELDEIDKHSELVATKKGLKTFLIVLIVLLFLAVFGLAIYSIQEYQQTNSVSDLLLRIGGALLFIGLAILFITIINKKINPVIEENEVEIQKHKEKASGLKEEAIYQVEPLLSLLREETTKETIEKVVPEIKIDKNFNIKREQYLKGKFGFNEIDDSTSVLDILSGEIEGNPFLIRKLLRCTMGTKKYTGSLVIHWTEVETDSKGNSHTVSRSETLHASVTKPCPYYGEETWLYYGNEAAPNLVFTHSPTHAERKSENELKWYVKREFNKLKKRERKDLNFTTLDNEEFEVLFNGFDRNNEVEYRLLFTPLAQASMLDLMKDYSCYGDDFTFAKRQKINKISSEHAQLWDFDIDVKKYYSYDIDEIKKKFLDYNNSFFKNLYFELAPLLAIPLYGQTKPSEYIYHHDYKSNYTLTEGEYMVNQLGRENFANPRSDLDRADVICNTRLSYKKGKADVLDVYASSYQTFERRDYVSVHGGDGRWHDVPVDWIEYVEVERTSSIEMEELEEDRRDYRKVENQLEDYLCAYKHNIFATYLNNSQSEDIDDIIKKIFK